MQQFVIADQKKMRFEKNLMRKIGMNKMNRIKNDTPVREYANRRSNKKCQMKRVILEVNRSNENRKAKNVDIELDEEKEALFQTF